ncbi:MAG: hypothetical protein ACI9J4_001228 [Paraglaciecola sp.]
MILHRHQSKSFVVLSIPTKMISAACCAVVFAYLLKSAIIWLLGIALFARALPIPEAAPVTTATVPRYSIIFNHLNSYSHGQQYRRLCSVSIQRGNHAPFLGKSLIWPWVWHLLWLCHRLYSPAHRDHRE